MIPYVDPIGTGIPILYLTMYIRNSPSGAWFLRLELRAKLWRWNKSPSAGEGWHFSRIWGNWRWEALEILILEDKSIVFVKYEIWNVKLQTWYVYFSKVDSVSCYGSKHSGLLRQGLQENVSQGGVFIVRIACSTLDNCELWTRSFFPRDIQPWHVHVYFMSIDMNLLYCTPINIFRFTYRHVPWAKHMYIYTYISPIRLYIYFYTYTHTALLPRSTAVKLVSGFDCFYSSRPFVDQRPGCSVFFSRSQMASCCQMMNS